LARAPTERQEVAAVVLGRRLYVAGGLNRSGAVSTVQYYDTRDGRWHEAPSLPVRIHHAMAAVFHGKVIVAGGFLGGRALYSGASDRVFALEGERWVELPRLRRPRGAAGMAAVGDALVVAGGQNGRTLIGATEIFDGQRWRDAASIPTPRDHLSVVADTSFVYAIGGRELSAARNQAALERFDPATGRWKRLARMPQARGGLGAGVYNNMIIVMGGEGPAEVAGPGGVYPAVFAYDVARNTWRTLPAPLPEPVHGIGVGVIGRTLYVACGGTNAGVGPSSLLQAGDLR
jgi:serine/threonine-protein kinase PknK